jgi:hypothetical protein
MLLEVALLEEDDSSWTLLPHSSSGSGAASKAAAVGDVVEEEVFEYERYLPLRGWSADHLSGLTDPAHYMWQSNSNRRSSTFPKVALPQVGALAVLGRMLSCSWSVTWKGAMPVCTSAGCCSTRTSWAS